MSSMEAMETFGAVGVREVAESDHRVGLAMILDPAI